MAELAVPNGLEQVVAEFGDVRRYVQEDGTLDPRWESEYLTRVAIPFPLELGWDRSKTISGFRCHRRMSEVFAEVFARLLERGLRDKVQTFGGCFMFRPQRGGSKLSTHCWGIAVDLNPETNQMGSVGDMDAGVVGVFREAGFVWGGDWVGPRRDGMHFQYCRGY